MNNNDLDLEFRIIIDNSGEAIDFFLFDKANNKRCEEDDWADYIKKAIKITDKPIQYVIDGLDKKYNYDGFNTYFARHLNSPNCDLLLLEKYDELKSKHKDYSKYMKNIKNTVDDYIDLFSDLNDFNKVYSIITYISECQDDNARNRAILELTKEYIEIGKKLSNHLPPLLKELTSFQFDLASDLLTAGSTIIYNHINYLKQGEEQIEALLNGTTDDFDFSWLDSFEDLADANAMIKEIDDAIEAYSELEECFGLLSPEFMEKVSDIIDSLEEKKEMILTSFEAITSLKRDVETARENGLFSDDEINVDLLAKTYNSTRNRYDYLFDKSSGQDTPLYSALLNNFLSSYDSGYCKLTNDIRILRKLRDNMNNASAAVYDPIILDLNGNGYEIERKSSGAYFDLNCDGFAERINWTTKDAILAVDKNENGIIDDGNEVFGDFFVLENGQRARNGFEALSQFDSNNDGLIDETDTSFGDLLLWIDSNGNGISDEGELSSLSSHGIKSISLDYTTVNASTSSEAIIGNQSVFTYTNDVQNTLGEMWASADLFDSMEKGFENNTGFDTDSPNVRSFGKINSLRTAIELDETGSLAQMVESFITSTQREERYQLVEGILEILCHAENIDINSRGSNINARHLAVIEAVFGEDFVGVNGANPNPVAAEILNDTYRTIVDLYYLSMSGNKLNKYLNLIDYNSSEKTYDLSIFSNVVSFSVKSGFIDDGTLKDICSYLDLISLTENNDHQLLMEFRDYIVKSAPEYVDVLNSAFRRAIVGDQENNNINGTNDDDLILAGSGNDNVISNSGNDTLYGDAGDDMLDGGSGDDYLDGGSGNDTLIGRNGNDTYIFGRGYGQDTINESNGNSSNDRVVFADDVSVDDVEFKRSGNDLVISINDTDDSLRIVNQYSDSWYWVENFEFSDGTVITSEDLFSETNLYGSGLIEDFTSGYGNRNSRLSGSETDDQLYGYSGDDILDGGAGNDYLYGGSGNDTYIFGRGYGQDVISEQNFNSACDKVLFSKDISVNDIEFSRSGNDLIVTIKDSNDSLRIVNQYNDSWYWVENFEFADGTKITSDEIFNISELTGSGKLEDFDSGYGSRNTILTGMDSDDQIYGYSGNDTLYGDAGNDLLDGGYGDDYLDGGSGNDTLIGRNGNDIYIFGRGYGQDTINESNGNSSNDRVVFADDISVEDVEFKRSENDLVISINETDDSLRIVNQYSDSWYLVENFEFSDGTVITSEDLFSETNLYGSGKIEDFTGGFGNRNSKLTGAETDDEIYGYSGDDTLDGGAGTDYLYGGSGNDTYIFGRGYGQDVINEQGTNSSNDRILFDNSISINDLTISRDNNDIVISVKDSNDSLRLLNQYSDSWYKVELLEFADGTIAEINNELLDFHVLIEGEAQNTEEEILQSNAELLCNIYTETGFESNIVPESDNTIIDNDSTAISENDLNENVSDMTDVQVMILTENMSAFVNEDNVSDSINYNNINAVDTLDQFLVSSQT